MSDPIPFDKGILTDYLMGNLDAAMAILEPAIYEELRKALTGDVSPAALAKARDLANTAAESLLRTLTETQLQSMGDVLAQALVDGKRPADAWKSLVDVTELDSVRAKQLATYRAELQAQGVRDVDAKVAAYKEKLLDERRKVIAQTEGRIATSHARDVNARDRGAKFKAWLTVGDTSVSQVCRDNQAKGAIPIDQAFPSGAMTTPGHPRCRCSIAYSTSTKTRDWQTAENEKRTKILDEKIAAAKEAKKAAKESS